MKLNGKEILVCDCEGTMALDGEALAKACGGTGLSINRQLCRSQLDDIQRGASNGEPLIIACTQEAPLFLDALDDMGDTPDVRFTNIRERAGWSAEGAKATPKVAALLAEAALDIPPTTVVGLSAGSAVLVIGDDDRTIEAARQIAARMEVTALLTGNAETLPPRLMDLTLFQGNIREARGYLGAFRVTIDDLAAAVPSSRAAIEFEGSGRTFSRTYDQILDLRGGTSLFPAPEKRDGYYNPDPNNPALVQKALFEIADMVGTFEKPRYVDLQASLCAHSRSNITGCTRCLDQCPTGAITPDGDHVAVDPFICAGCGSCASVCPTGAMNYNLPASEALFQRLRTLLGTYLKAEGQSPVLLVHDTTWGEEMISAMAHMGRGLPADVLPFAVNEVTQVGLDFLLAASAYGATRVVLLIAPHKTEEAAGLIGEVATADMILEGLGYGRGRIATTAEADPTAVEANLYGLKALPAVTPATFEPMGGKRSLLDLPLKHLHRNAPAPVDAIDLPAGAPFGTVDVKQAGCTLCLACVSACPTGALSDSPDKPRLSFVEAACVQCGLCAATCPEKVMSLMPRLDFAAQNRGERTLKEEEPFACIRCGKPFGTRSSIERTIVKLTGHSMFAAEGRLDLIKMCEDCRVIAQTEDEEHPFASEPRALPRTTEDYMREREELRKIAADAEAARDADKD